MDVDQIACKLSQVFIYRNYQVSELNLSLKHYVVTKSVLVKKNVIMILIQQSGQQVMMDVAHNAN